MRRGGKPFAAAGIGPVRADRVGKIEFAAIPLRRTVSGEGQPEPSGGQISLAVVTEHPPGDEFIRLMKFFLPQKRARLLQFPEIAVVIEMARPPRPEGVFIEFDEFFGDAAENHRPDAAVADGERFIPAACRGSIGEQVLSVRHGVSHHGYPVKVHRRTIAFNPFFSVLSESSAISESGSPPGKKKLRI